jgi:hypothetical protein
MVPPVEKSGEADVHTPPAATPPAAAEPTNLVEDLERREVRVDKILPLHGPGHTVAICIKPPTRKAGAVLADRLAG